MSLQHKKFNKILIPTGIVLTSTLIGSLAGIYQKQKNDSSEDINLDVSTNVIDLDQIIINGMTTRELAEKSYNEYSEFYNSISSDPYIINEIDTMINVINGNVDGLSREEIIDSLEMVNQILYSDNLSQNIDNVNTSKSSDEYLYTPESCTIISSPKMSDFIPRESNIYSNVTEYEKLVSKMSEELRLTGTYSDELANEIRKSTIDMEVSNYNKDIDQMTGELSNEGLGYLQSAVNTARCSLCTKVTPYEHYLDTGNNFVIQISLTDEESDQNQQVITLGNAASDEAKELYTKNQGKLISTKYIDSMCNFEESLLQKAGYDINYSSKILNEQKLVLLKLKREELLAKKIEEEVSKNKILENINVTFSM